jgi:hypothetical protein
LWTQYSTDCGDGKRGTKVHKEIHRENDPLAAW